MMQTAKASSFARGRRGNFDNRREEVLKSAARLFSELGFRQATLEDVARALHITRPALYHYARSKEELAIQCAGRALEEIAELTAAALRQPTGREQMVDYFRRYADVACEDFGRFFVLVNEREFSPEMRANSRALRRQIQASVRGMIETGIADGSLRAVDSGDLARALFGAMNAIPHWYRPGRGRTPGQIAEDFLAMFLSGLAHESEQP